MQSAPYEFSRRLSARGVVTGVLVNLAILILFLSLAGALGFWELRLSELPDLISDFWFLGVIGWVISTGVGSYTASVASHSTTLRDGILHGVVTWAASCVAMAFVLVRLIENVGSIDLQNSYALLGAFVGNLFSLGTAIFGAVAGARSEAHYRVSARERKEIKTLHPKAG
jgi:hypothetical protein